MKSKPLPPVPVAALVSLGCAKNTVDSERILAQLIQAGFHIAEDPGDADVCLVNTCGFIDAAREETAGTIQALAQGRKRGKPAVIVAMGCLVERAAQIPGLAGFLEGADARVGFRDYLRLADLCRSLIRSRSAATVSAEPARPELPEAFHLQPRLITGAGHSVSLKISEGCSNACRFCTIPLIRGPQISRPMEDLLEETRQLAAAGAREILLIGQDTTSYGSDRYGRRRLADLIRTLSEGIGDDLWFRLMYAHPRFLDDATLEAIRADPRWCRYLDLPLQHISDRMLRIMGRGMTSTETRDLLRRTRERLPGVCLRTAFIVGHPGETGADFEELQAFVREASFLHAGVFVYSDETGTRSAALPDRVPPEVARDRHAQLMGTLRENSRLRLRDWIGRTLDVMIDGPADPEPPVPAGVAWVARHRGQGPEVDGTTLIRRHPRLRGAVPGDRYPVRVCGGLDYDLVAEFSPGD